MAVCFAPLVGTIGNLLLCANLRPEPAVITNGNNNIYASFYFTGYLSAIFLSIITDDFRYFSLK
jgi:hypothetical protein